MILTALASAVVPRLLRSSSTNANPPEAPSPGMEGGLTAKMLASCISDDSAFILSITAAADSFFTLRSSQSFNITKTLASLDMLPPLTTENPLMTR